jgi:hypothetical protein
MSISAPQRTMRRVSPLPDVVGLGGALAGLAGGLAMAIVAAVISASIGQDIWRQPKLIAAMFYGPAAAQDGFVAAPVLAGSLVHMAVSALLGAIFGIVTRRVLHLTSDFWTPLLTGLNLWDADLDGGLLCRAADRQPTAARDVRAGLYRPAPGLRPDARPGVHVAAAAAVRFLSASPAPLSLGGLGKGL